MGNKTVKFIEIEDCMISYEEITSMLEVTHAAIAENGTALSDGCLDKVLYGLLSKLEHTNLELKKAFMERKEVF